MGICAPPSLADAVDAITPATKYAPGYAAAVATYVGALTKDSSDTLRTGMSSAVACMMVCWMRPPPEQRVLLEAVSRAEFVNRIVGARTDDDALYQNVFEGDQYDPLSADAFVHVGVAHCLSMHNRSPRFEGLARVVMNTAAMLIATMPTAADDPVAQHNINTARAVVHSQLPLTRVALVGEAFRAPTADICPPSGLPPGSTWA